MMCKLKLIFVMSLITCTVAQLGLNEEREELIRGVNCNKNCQLKSPEPVCGTNGQTYKSICHLERDICKKVKVKLKHMGECTLAEKCRDDQAFRLEQVANGHTIHVPTCLADGSYAPIQCHNFTLFCWCSRVDGELIPETIQKDKKPECLGDRSSAPPLDSRDHGGDQDRCRGGKRKQFFKNMVDVLNKDYRNHARGGRGGGRGGGGGGGRREPIKWKFSHLDQDGDGFLKRREYRGLHRSVKKFVKPKKCARLFPNFCDTNKDKKLTLDEWLTCFSSKSGRKSPTRKNCKNARNCTPKTSKPKQIMPSCKLDRTLLLQEANTENNSIPIPECQSNGKYKPTQCHLDICFCVDELTGNSLEGTAVTNGTPDCSKPLPHAREWPGCKGSNKTKFMEDLKKYLVNKVADEEKSPEGSSPQTVEEFAAIYHFKRLDKNNNNFLEKRERRDVKKFFKRNAKLRVCGKKMAEYCDVDKDRKLSLDEWVACVILTPPQPGGVRSGGGVGSVEIRRYEENPIVKYLTPEDEVQYHRRHRDARRGPTRSRRSLNRFHNT